MPQEIVRYACEDRSSMEARYRHDRYRTAPPTDYSIRRYRCFV